MTTTTELRVPLRGPAPSSSTRAGRHAVPGHGLATWVHGRPEDPRWVRPSLWVLLVGSALLYLWNLDASGTANDFYAAAVQAGTQSWKALLFGSLDSSNFITVDKPPAALWIMGLSGRVFGFSSWSMLAPQAVMGVASVGLLYLAVRRWAGPRAGLLAGAALALTPVAVLMFRFDNPDAMLVLCMVAAAYAVVRAVDAAERRAGTWWIAGAGALLGLGFLTKMLQAFLVLPALGAAFLLVAAVPVRRRLMQLGVGVAALVASVAWYVLLVDLWPADSRPYIGGSTDNTLLDLVLGYNGLGRILGGSGNGGGGGGAGGGAGGGGGFGGSTGITRMFNSEFGGQASWLLPAALIALIAGLWLTRRAPRTDRTRGALVIWGGWMVVTALVFSFMSGTIHAYYVVALAPGIVGTLAVGGRQLWRHREHWAARLTLAATVAVTAAWSFVLLGRSTDFLPVLRWVVLVAGVLAAAGLLVPTTGWRRLGSGAGRRALPVVLLAALIAGAGGSTACAVQTAATSHQGSIVSAGPSTGSDSGPGGGGQGGPGGGQRPTGTPPGGGQAPTGQAPADQTSTDQTSTDRTSTDRTSTDQTSTDQTSTDQASTGDAAAQTSTGQAGAQGGGSGGPGGTTSSAELDALLTSAGTRWAAATVSAQGASTIELSSGTAVMAIGGFSGTDAAPSLAQFQAYVAAGDVHWFLASSGGQGGGPGGQSDSVGTQITEWVAAHYTATTVGGTTVYDLTSPTS